MKSAAHTFLVALCALIPVLLPVALIVSQGIWAPVAINQETFGVHFTAYPTLALGYHFIGNAMAFAAIYTYLPAFVVHQVLPLTEFDRFQVWWIGVFLIHAALMVGLALWIARQRLPLLAKICIVLVGGTLPHYLASGYANLLTPNYHLIEAVLYVLASAMVVLTLQGRLQPGQKTAIVAGIAVAVAFWTKFTLIITVGAFFGLVVLLGGRAGLGWRVLLSGASFVAATGLLAAVYFVGHPSYVMRFAADVPAMYSADFLSQRFPPLVDELTAWTAPISTFQNLFRIWLVSMIGGLVWTIFHPTIQRWAFLGMTMLVSAFFVRFLIERTAPNTFGDVVLFGSFVISVWLADWASSRSWRFAAAGLLVIYVWFVGMTTWRQIGEWQYPGWIEGMRAASESARAIDDDIRSRPELPVVYYWTGPLEALFPSTFLYSLFSGNQQTKQIYFNRYSPRSVFQAVERGIVRGPQIMVIPLRIAPGYDPLAAPRPGDTPLFDLYPTFAQIRDDPRQQCRRHQVWTPILGYSADTSKSVLVCTLTADAVQRYDEVDDPVQPDGLANLALRQKVQASTPNASLPPDLAVDGHTSEDAPVTTVASVASSWQPWIEIDLGAPRDVDSIQLWGRVNPCCVERLRNVYVFTSMEPITATADARAIRTAPGITSHYLDGIVHTPTRIPVGEPARYVRIQVADTNFLELTEIQVWGKEAGR